MLVVATNAETGEVKYFDKGDMKQDCYDILKASSAIPFVCHPYSVESIPYYDGALSDPAPIEKAFSCVSGLYGITKVWSWQNNMRKRVNY